MCALDFPVVERSCQPVPWCLRALLLMSSEGISLCLLCGSWNKFHTTVPYQTHNTKSIQEFLPAVSDSLRCSFGEFHSVYLEACFS